MIGTLDKRPGQTFNQFESEFENKPDIDVDMLILMAQDGKTEAFGLLYEEFIDHVYRYVFVRTGHVRQAEDMTQEVFLRAFKGIADYRDRGIPFLGWLLRIAHNLVIDFYRRERKKHFVILDETWTPSPDNPASEAERRFEINEIRKAITSLPPAQREAFSLRFIAGLTVSETANVMGKSEGAVKTLQHEAVVKLRKMMKEE